MFGIALPGMTACGFFSYRTMFSGVLRNMPAMNTRANPVERRPDIAAGAGDARNRRTSAAAIGDDQIGAARCLRGGQTSHSPAAQPLVAPT
jgi:hypothetical protein